MIVEPVPALQHVAALLDPYDAGYREWVTRELRSHHEIDFVRDYWERTFPQMVKHNPRFFAEAVAAPANKIARFLTSPSLNLLMTHPIQLDLESIIQRREILIVNGSKGAVGESNANLFCSMLILLIQRALHQIQRVDAEERVQAALVIDEAHNVFIPAFSTLLAEGRSGGIEVAAAFQYTGQIADENVRAGVRSLLQNVSIFRQRDFQDARAAAALAMEVFQDNISGDIEDQRRIRIDPIDIVQQPNYRAVNLWLAHGFPQPAATASTSPMEELVGDSGGSRGPPAPRARTASPRRSPPRPRALHTAAACVVGSVEPIVARYRTVHVDLPAWTECPPLTEIVRVAVVLKPTKGEPLAYVAESPDGSRRRYEVELPAEPHAPGWLPAGTYGVQVLVWVGAEPEPRKWTSLVDDMQTVESEMAVEIARGAAQTARERSRGGVMRAALAQRMVLSGEGLSAGTVQWGNREGSPPAVRLTDRDLRLMALLYDVNFLSASQLLMLGWGDSVERTGQKRLKRLHDGEYFDRFRPVRESGTAEWNYRLSSRGWSALTERGCAPRDGAYTPTAITSISYTEHDLQLAALVLRIAAGSRARSRLEDFIDRMPFTWKGPRSGRIDTDTTEEFECSPAAKLSKGTRLHPEGSRQGYLEPDATLIARSGDDLWAVLIEYDRTERPHKQIDRLRRYDRWLLNGWRRGPLRHTLDPSVGGLPDRTRAAPAPPDRDRRQDLLCLVRQ